MTIISKTDFETNRGAVSVSDADFQRLSECAERVVDTLCFGRADRNEEAARKAMTVLIAAWLDDGGLSALNPDKDITHETVGNYSVSYSLPKTERTLFGLPVTAEALMILDLAGLRDPAV